jgi:hypothetical protein
VNFCTNGLPGYAGYVAAGAIRIQADALSRLLSERSGRSRIVSARLTGKSAARLRSEAQVLMVIILGESRAGA